jgi:hypothetical protein
VTVTENALLSLTAKRHPRVLRPLRTTSALRLLAFLHARLESLVVSCHPLSGLSLARLHSHDRFVEVTDIRRSAVRQELLEVVEHGLELEVVSHDHSTGCLDLLEGVEQRYVRMRS